MMDHAEMAMQRFYRVNWLDPRRFTGIFLRANLFSRPTPAELVLGMLGQNGGIRRVNVLSPAQTGLVQLTEAELAEFTLGDLVYLS